MKNLLIILVVMMGFILPGQAQEKLKIGEIKNGKLVITNLEALKAHFMKSLNHSGTLGTDYQISASPEGDRCFVYYPVKGNTENVSSIGIMLVKIRNDFYIVENQPKTEAAGPGGGGSLEIQCVGDDCSACLPNIKWVPGNWMPVVYCECLLQGSGKCNMTSKAIIRVDI
jgi:hypothetical protein